MPKKDARIVVLQRGWVYVGIFSKPSKDGECILKNASCIRRWGTSKGLGELVKGPLPNTVLDAAGTVRFHELAVVNMIDVDGEAWSKHIA